MRCLATMGLALSFVLLVPVDGFTDEILCADGRPRAGLVLEHHPNTATGLVVSYIPFRGRSVDTSSYGIEKTGESVWDQKCDVLMSPAKERSAMIAEWRTHVPVAVVTRRNGGQATLIGAGIGINARSAAVCIGYCGRSRVFELVEASAARYLSLDSVRRIAVVGGDQATPALSYVSTDGKTLRATVRALGMGRYYFLYGFVENEPGRLSDTEIELRDILEIVMGH